MDREFSRAPRDDVILRRQGTNGLVAVLQSCNSHALHPQPIKCTFFVVVGNARKLQLTWRAALVCLDTLHMTSDLRTLTLCTTTRFIPVFRIVVDQIVPHSARALPLHCQEWQCFLPPGSNWLPHLATIINGGAVYCNQENARLLTDYIRSTLHIHPDT